MFQAITSNQSELTHWVKPICFSLSKFTWLSALPWSLFYEHSLPKVQFQGCREKEVIITQKYSLKELTTFALPYLFPFSAPISLFTGGGSRGKNVMLFVYCFCRVHAKMLRDGKGFCEVGESFIGKPLKSDQ